jgi:hypothetical protein
MKVLPAFLIVVVLAAASGADAWPWSRSRNRNGHLPKPIDSPIVRPKERAEKATRSRHPSRYMRAEWGAEKSKTQNLRQPHEGNHSIFIRN